MSTEHSDHAPLGKLFALLTKWYVGAVTAKLSALPIDRHFYVLTVIDDMQGEVTQKELAEMVWTDKASMVRILDYLTEKDMIERIQDPADRRAYRIRTTDFGRSLVPKIKEAFEAVNNSALAGLPASEAQSVLAALRKMACNLSQLPSEEILLRLDRHPKETT
jgi:DNA-binding MarR family transcriptional regulator